MLRFCDELIARVTRTAQAASSCCARTRVLQHRRLQALGNGRVVVLDRCAHAEAIRETVQAIQGSAWQTIEDYPKEGEAQIAEIVDGDQRLASATPG
jgi:hypothetical protein